MLQNRFPFFIIDTRIRMSFCEKSNEEHGEVVYGQFYSEKGNGRCCI